MNYKQKYIKYKNKYFKLKNLSGGASLLKHLPGGKRSNLLKEELVQMVNEKTAVFYVDGAHPDNFSIGLKLELKPGYHIHAIFNKGDKYYIDGKEFEHEGSLNMNAFVKTIEDKDGKKWVIYDHNKDSKLDEHLINSF